MQKIRTWRGGIKRGLAFLSLALVLAVCAVNALAQTETGQINGKVTDPNGATVAGGKVLVKSLSTSRELTATANDQGLYTVTSLQPGLYDVMIDAGSFKQSSQRVQVTVGSKVSLPTQLALTEVQGNTVTVVASEGVAVETQTQEVSNIVTGTQIRELPTITRNPYALIGLANNVSNDDPGPPVPGVGVSSRGAGFNINGQRAASTNVLLDGVDNTNAYYASVGQNIRSDSVGEFRVVTSNFSRVRTVREALLMSRARRLELFHGSLMSSTVFQSWPRTDSTTMPTALRAASLRATSLVTPSVG